MSWAHVLAVDDEPAQLSSLKRILRRSDVEVETATSGRLGLRVAVCWHPDLILLDVSMPTMSGLEFARRLRRLESRAAPWKHDGDSEAVSFPTPIIFVTALGATHQRVSGLDAGAVDYITKPFEPDELRARVRNQLKRVGEQKACWRAAVEEQRRLQSTIHRMRSCSKACAPLIFELNTDLELAGLVFGRDAARNLLARAKKNVGGLTQSLLQIAQPPATREARR
jgi:DNA-binding response OmpR family regulator